MLKVRDLCIAMERIAPVRFAASWDNVGLLVGDREAPLTKVLLCIDLSPDVWDEARAGGASAVVAYHPPIFEAKKTFVRGDVAFDAASAGIAIYSPHTALDGAEGGTNDVLADALGLVARKPLRVLPEKDAAYKLVTFVPGNEVENVARALAEAGAGVIGNYTNCSWRSEGTGTFQGGDGSHPVVGARGVLEHAPEVRLEVVCPIAKSPAIVAALFHAHPYETPAYDLVRLAPAPEKNAFSPGYGRVGDLPPTSPRELVAKVKDALGLSNVLVAGPLEGEVTRAAVGAGACGDLLTEVLREKATFFLLGELRHHDALRAAKAGVTIVCTMHSNSERKTLDVLRDKLQKSLSGVDVVVSRTDADPFSFA